MERYLREAIASDLENKMVFIGGPRQVGKTTLSLSFLNPPTADNPCYLNWDSDIDRMRILKLNIPVESGVVVLDEIHKYLRWRNLMKGLFDKNRNRIKYIVTGSAKLDYYRRGGDSLQGRYHYHRLHPLSLGEFKYDTSMLQPLLKFGGFPEPLFKGEDVFWRRWSRERLSHVVQDDLTDLHQVKEVALIRLLVEALPDRLQSPLSLKSLSEDLQVTHQTVGRWLEILEQLYVCFRISPYGSPKIRAVKKEQKLYLWDWSMAHEGGARFENLVASQLLKFCHQREDIEGHGMELRYLRDTDGREVDFVVLQNRKPLFAVECKTGERAVSKHVSYFKARTPIPKFYQVHLGTKDYVDGNFHTRVLPFATFCQELQMP